MSSKRTSKSSSKQNSTGKQKSGPPTVQNDPSERPSKRKREDDYEYDLSWIFLHKDATGVQHLRIKQDMLNQQIYDLYDSFVSTIEAIYRLSIDQPTLQVYAVKQDIDIKNINAIWMTETLDNLGPYESRNFVENLKKMAIEAFSQRMIEDVINDIVSPKSKNQLHLMLTARSSDVIVVPPQDPELDRLQEPTRSYTRTVLQGKEGKITCPSKAAKSERYIAEQSKPDVAIYDGRHGLQQGNRLAPPIEIFHPIFDKFYSNLHDATKQPSKELILLTYRFMEEASTISASEDGKFSKLRPQLNELLQRVVLSVGRETKAGGTVWLIRKNLNAMLVVMELKREYGEGGSDPAAQASFAFRNYWLKNQGVRDLCCCPTLIIAIGGPWFGLLGGVFTDKFIVQRMTDLTWTGWSSAYEDKRLYWLARKFHSLRMCLDDLEQYYLKLSETEFKASDYHRYTLGLQERLGFQKMVKQRLFPYPQRFTEKDEHHQVKWRKFRYIRPLETYSACVTYLAKICHDDDDDDDDDDGAHIVVKSVAQYGDDVHRFLADEGRAPKLHYFGPLLSEDGTYEENKWLSSTPNCNGEWAFPGLHLNRLQMVVMDYIKACDEEDLPSEDRCGEQIAEVLDKLHDHGFVFGDLRKPNVIFDKDGKVKFIDFDWSGRYKGSTDGLIPDPKDHEKPCYPVDLSRDVKWATDTEKLRLAIIKPEHDWAMLETHFNYSRRWCIR